jgi:hypothetical protein
VAALATFWTRARRSVPSHVAAGIDLATLGLTLRNELPRMHHPALREGPAISDPSYTRRATPGRSTHAQEGS